MPPIKVKLELHTCGGLPNSKLPRPIIIVGQLEIGLSSQIVFITLFFGSCYGLPFTSLKKLCKNAQPKSFCFAKPDRHV
jgi:hypothetical protein